MNANVRSFYVFGIEKGDHRNSFLNAP